MSEPTKTKEAVISYHFSFKYVYQWIPENHFFISLSLAIVFLLSGIRVLIAMTSGALFNELSLLVLVAFATPIFLGPLIYALTQKYQLAVIPVALWGIVIGKLGQQLIAEAYTKLFFTMLLLIAVTIWVTWLIPLSIQTIGSKEVILAVILGNVSLLQMDTEHLSEEHNLIINDISTASERAKSIIKQLQFLL